MFLKPGDLVYVKNIETKISSKVKFESLYCYDFEIHYEHIINEFLNNIIKNDAIIINFCPLCILRKNKQIKIYDKVCTVIKTIDVSKKDLKTFLKPDFKADKFYLLDNYLINWCCILYDNTKTVWLPYINVSKL